jgi:hypothetical protein
MWKDKKSPQLILIYLSYYRQWSETTEPDGFHRSEFILKIMLEISIGKLSGRGGLIKHKWFNWFFHNGGSRNLSLFQIRTRKLPDTSPYLLINLFIFPTQYISSFWCLIIKSNYYSCVRIKYCIKISTFIFLIKNSEQRTISL